MKEFLPGWRGTIRYGKGMSFGKVYFNNVNRWIMDLLLER
jgi:hypothetical protein